MSSKSDDYAKEKKSIVFLHGFGCSGKTFEGQLKYFSKYFNVYAPDLKGFGKNVEMPYPYCLDDYVNELKDWLDKNGIVKPHVVAHSFGGRIAIKCTACNEGIFDKIVLTGSAGLKPKRSFRYRLKKAKFNILKKFVKREKLKKYYSKDYIGLSPIMKKSFQLITGEYLDGYLDKIKNEVFIINGEKDKETPPYTAKKLNKKIKRSGLYFIKDAGHFCFLERQDVFNLSVKEFLLGD